MDKNHLLEYAQKELQSRKLSAGQNFNKCKLRHCRQDGVEGGEDSRLRDRGQWMTLTQKLNTELTAVGICITQAKQVNEETQFSSKRDK